MLVKLMSKQADASSWALGVVAMPHRCRTSVLCHSQGQNHRNGAMRCGESLTALSS